MEGLRHMVDHDLIPSRKWASHLPVSHRVGHSVLAVDNKVTDDVADVYNQAGDDYASYADGDPSQPFFFDGMHGYADRCVWAVLEKKLTDLRATGASSVRLLDAGCGPGTWLSRLVMAIRMMAERGRNTLVLVHRRQLMDQWIERLAAFSSMPGDAIGMIGGGRRKPKGQVDVALVQNLVRK